MRSYLSARRGQTPVKIINNLPQPSLPVEGESVGGGGYRNVKDSK